MTISIWQVEKREQFYFILFMQESGKIMFNDQNKFVTAKTSLWLAE